MAKNQVLKIKYYQSIIAFITVILDICTILLSFLCAYFIWQSIGPFLAMEMYEELEITRYGLLYGVTLITIIVGFEVNNLYKSQRSMFNIREFQLIFRTIFGACCITMIILFMADKLYFDRGIFILTWVLVLIFLFVERYIFFKCNIFLNSLGIAETSVLIYGTGAIAKQLISKFKMSPKLGYQIAGFIDDTVTEKEIMGIPILGNFSNLKDLILNEQAEKLFIALPHVSSEKIIKILNVCRETGCKFQIIPNIYETALEKVRMIDVEGIPLIGIQEPRASMRSVMVKRFMDILVSGILVLILFPLFFTSTILALLIAPAPLFTTKYKVGRYEKLFKFPYLSESVLQTAGHSRFYPFIIKLLKLMGITALPRLLHVIIGNMSLVGPRADSPQDVKNYTDIQKHKLKIRPGLVGLWGFSRPQNTLLYEDKDLDIYYIQNMGLFLDLVIILRKLFRIL